MTDANKSSPRPAEMLVLLEKALAADPENVTAVRNVGIMLNRMGRAREAEALLRRALALESENGSSQYALAQNLLGQGRFAEGWHYYSARGRTVGPARSGIPTGVNVPKWAGEPLAGLRLTILPEQGVGDQLQFMRFLSPLLAAGATITMLTSPALTDLIRTSFPSIIAISAQGAIKFPASDYWVTLGDLPVLLGASPEDLPLPPYLVTDQQWSAAPEGFKVGVMTTGNANHLNDAYRSLTSSAASALLERLPGVVIDLQPQNSGVKNFAQTAALINETDLVVSVDTAVAHLAGGLGKKCFLLLPGYNTDWRWMRDRDDSPWYPRHKLYRGTEDGSWGDAIERLIDDARLLAERV